VLITPVDNDSILPQQTKLAPQIQTPATGAPVPFGFRRRRERPAPVTEWIWPYFEVTTIDHEWIVKRTGKRKLTDRDIRCIYVDDKTGVRCNWETTDSARQSATANMKSHLAKHGIVLPSTVATPAPSQKQSSTVRLMVNKT
jgi:hypothetical protein